MAKNKGTEDVTHTVEQESPITQDPQPNSQVEVQGAVNAPVDQAALQAQRAHEEANTGYRPNIQPPAPVKPLPQTATPEELHHRINTLESRLRRIESRIAADTQVPEPAPEREPAATDDIRPTPEPRGVATEGDTATDTTRE